MSKLNKFFHAAICTFLFISALNHSLWCVARFMHEIHDHGDHLTHSVEKIDGITVEVHQHHGACKICETLNQLKPEGPGSDHFITGIVAIFSPLITPLKHEAFSRDYKHFGIRAPPIV